MKRILGVAIVIVLSFWAIRSLLSSGYFPMHDDTQVARVVEMGRALREGQFPVRWVSNLGYGLGYPIFNFYGPLPYYAGGLLYALGFTGLAATKIMMGLGIVLSGVTMFLVVADLIGVSGGILAAVLYMYAPYHAVDVYVRGAVGEYWTLIFLPLIFWGFWRISHKKFSSGLLVGSLGLFGLVVSHTILGYAGMIFVVLAGLVLCVWGVRRGEWGRVRYLVLFILLGLGLSAFFWMPAITEMKYTNVVSQISVTSDYRDHFVCLPELWDSPWGFGGSAKGCLDGFSFKIGKEYLILGLIIIFGLISGILGTRKGKRIAYTGLSLFILSVFFMVSSSSAVWEAIPLFAYVQYPWRFLAFAIFGISLMCSTAVYIIPNSWLRITLVIVVIGGVLFIEAKRFAPQYLYEKPAGTFETPSDIRFRVSKISDEYLPPVIVKPAKVEDALRDTIAPSQNYTLAVERETDTYRKYSFLSSRDNTIVARLAYFPGWHFIVNANEVTPKLENGLPVITVPSQFSTVQMQFRDTPVRTMANLISLLSLGAWIYFYDRKNKKNNS